MYASSAPPHVCSSCPSPTPAVRQVVTVKTTDGHLVQVLVAELEGSAKVEEKPKAVSPYKTLAWQTQFVAQVVLAFLSFKEDPKTSLIAFAVGLAMGANSEVFGIVSKLVPTLEGCGGNAESSAQSHLPWQLSTAYFVVNRWNHLDHGPVETCLHPWGIGIQLAHLFQATFFPGTAGVR